MWRCNSTKISFVSFVIVVVFVVIVLSPISIWTEFFRKISHPFEWSMVTLLYSCSCPCSCCISIGQIELCVVKTRNFISTGMRSDTQNAVNDMDMIVSLSCKFYDSIRCCGIFKMFGLMFSFCRISLSFCCSSWWIALKSYATF